MDLATLALITVCGGHCKKMNGDVEYIATPTLAACHASVGKGVVRKDRVSLPYNEGDYIATYAMCLPISPVALSRKWFSFDDSKWWQNKSRQTYAKAAD